MITVTEIVYFFKVLRSAFIELCLIITRIKERSSIMGIEHSHNPCWDAREAFFSRSWMVTSYHRVMQFESYWRSWCSLYGDYVLRLSQHHEVKEVTKWMSKVVSLSHILDGVDVILFLCRQVESQFQRFVSTVSLCIMRFC